MVQWIQSPNRALYTPTSLYLTRQPCCCCCCCCCCYCPCTKKLCMLSKNLCYCSIVLHTSEFRTVAVFIRRYSRKLL